MEGLSWNMGEAYHAFPPIVRGIDVIPPIARSGPPIFGEPCEIRVALM
jgi:hypothetical protein